MDSDMMDVDTDPVPNTAPAPTFSAHSARNFNRAPMDSRPKIQWVAPPTENVFTVQDGKWIVGWWGDSTCTPEAVEAFLSRWPPSRTPKSYAAWVAIQRDPSPYNPPSSAPPPPLEAEKDVQGLQRSFNAFLAAQGPQGLTVSALDELSRRHNVVVGKWLVFVKPHQADRIWGNIVRYICHDMKVGQAKIAAREDSDNPQGGWERDEHTICVYVDNYLDLEEVKRVRDGLRKVGVTWKISFKPDAYTYLGIYSRNEWGLRPTRYYDDEL